VVAFGPEWVTLFHSSIALMEWPSQKRDPAVKLKRNHTEALSFTTWRIVNGEAERYKVGQAGAGVELESADPYWSVRAY
jgi:hypothetical protein